MCLFMSLIFHCQQSNPLMCLFFRQRVYVLYAYFLEKKPLCAYWAMWLLKKISVHPFYIRITNNFKKTSSYSGFFLTLLKILFRFLTLLKTLLVRRASYLTKYCKITRKFTKESIIFTFYFLNI